MINRKEILKKHSPIYKKINKDAPLSVGNGAFCFTADFTGLQTFFDEYGMANDSFPLCTMAEWGWHSYPPAKGEEEKLRLTPFDTYGRTVYYASDNTGQEELFKRIRVNAHKFNLGKAGFILSGRKLSVNECKPVSQYLSLWEGILTSEFLINDETVKTETFVHPDEDTLFVRVSSGLLKTNDLQITVVFPYGSHKKNASDFSVPEKHTTRQIKNSARGGNCGISVERILDNTSYKVNIDGKSFALSVDENKHTVILSPQSEKIEFSVNFELIDTPELGKAGVIYKETKKRSSDSFEKAQERCKAFWELYWNSGGFLNFSGSADKRADELERRIALSQYLVAVQSRGYLPPAETGLTCNSWYGKFHLEMIFWHHAHFALWGRGEEIKKILGYYKNILPVALEIASSQGCSGARWPKMCDPSGKNTPSSVAVFLIWQQVHPIMLAELCWRVDSSKSFLNEYCDIVVETAEFIKSFVHWEEKEKRYVLGPPYIPAQERHDPTAVLNAAYELEYFRWGLKKADEWLGRLGKPSRYEEIIKKLSFPAHKDGVYLAHENCPDTFSKPVFHSDHPSMLAMYGILDSDKIDLNIMSATLDKVLSVWDKKTFYGWDFPMMAMTACRLGRYKDAVDMLLMESPKNTCMENGHNRMTGDDALPLYLPGNGGLLLAAAMLCAGYGDKKGSSFPDGFSVETEGIYPYI